MWQIPENFKWDSKDQEEGWLAFVKWCKDKNVSISHFLPAFPVFIIQKLHDSHEYWIEMMSGQIASLQNEIRGLKEEVASLRAESKKES